MLPQARPASREVSATAKTGRSVPESTAPSQSSPPTRLSPTPRRRLCCVNASQLQRRARSEYEPDHLRLLEHPPDRRQRYSQDLVSWHSARPLRLRLRRWDAHPPHEER